MRIGIDYTAAVRQGAGIGRYTRGLVAALAERDRENRYVVFSAGADPPGTAWPENFRRRALPLTDRHLAILWQRLRLPLPVECVTGRLDLFHSPDFVLPPVRRARTVLTVHDLSFMRYPECSSPPLLRYLMDAVPRSVRRADAILADSESTRHDVIELLGVPAERVFVIYPGAESRFAPGPADDAETAAVLARYGIRRPYIFSVGTVQPRKNYARLIQAYAALRRERRLPHELVISGGRGWLTEEVDAAIASVGPEAPVRMVGFAADADLPALYRAADLFAFPSLYEGFGIPILEALGCGTPVVAGNASSLPEAAGDAALLVDPFDVAALADAMGRLLDDSTLRHTLRARGLEQVRRFRWDESAARLLDVYATVARRGD